MVIEAIGGAGKSALAWHWLKERAAAVRPAFAGVFWYSFYEGGADMAALPRTRCRAVLQALGAPEPTLPAFDPATAEPIPYKAEIQALIAKLRDVE